MNMSVMLSGGSFVNKGAEAMALTVYNKLVSAFPGIKIYMRVDPIYFKVARQNGFVPLNGRSPKTLKGKLFSKFISFKHYFTDYALIDIGGYQFGDPWGWNKLKKVAQTLQYCKFFNTKTIYMPQAMGPFSHIAFSRYIPVIINNSSLFFVRDKQSFKEVNKICPISEIMLQPDIAWNFNSKDTDIDNILKKYRINQQMPTVCITPNLRVYERQGDLYLRILDKIISILILEGYQVILLGHELRIDKKKDDRFLCRLLKEKNTPAIHIDEYLNAKQVKNIIGTCDFIISSRFHALIAAFSQYVPAAAIGWSHKYEELLSDIGLQKNLIEISDSRDKDEIDVWLYNFIKHLDVQKKILHKKVPEIVSASTKMLEQVINVL